eukprot:6214539-Pleurochrysis_carterae.AAC.8
MTRSLSGAILSARPSLQLTTAGDARQSCLVKARVWVEWPNWSLERDRSLRELGYASLTSITCQAQNASLPCMSKTF